MWKLKLLSLYSFSGNICFPIFSVLVLCSADGKEKIQCLITVEAEVQKEEDKEKTSSKVVVKDTVDTELEFVNV
jgi:hypothetical protein